MLFYNLHCFSQNHNVHEASADMTLRLSCCVAFGFQVLKKCGFLISVNRSQRLDSTIFVVLVLKMFVLKVVHCSLICRLHMLSEFDLNEPGAHSNNMFSARDLLQ
jgi:hypothetical protein